jgi:hypothetical protein
LGIHRADEIIAADVLIKSVHHAAKGILAEGRRE